MTEIMPGVDYWAAWLDRAAQEALCDAVAEVVRDAPLFRPTMPRTGQPFSVEMSNCGPLGWVSDSAGYRYQPLHPVTGRPWPAMPPVLLATWEALSGYPHSPEACLINSYTGSARMGLHQDRDEEEQSAPVLSISLGDTCVFRIGGLTRRAPTRSVKLASGDVVRLGGAARLAFHGVDRLIEGTSTLLPSGGRLNLTLRRVTRP